MKRVQRMMISKVFGNNIMGRVYMTVPLSPNKIYWEMWIGQTIIEYDSFAVSTHLPPSEVEELLNA